MLRDLFNKGKCKLGLHQGEWQYQSQDQCVQVRVCELCQAESRRTEHTWGEWEYLRANSCDLIRACQRCRETDTGVEHSWADWEYQHINSCAQVQVCGRCGEKSAHTRVSHERGEWQYEEAYRAPIRSCLRCSERESSFALQRIVNVPEEPIPIASSPVAGGGQLASSSAPVELEPETTDVTGLMQLFTSGDSEALKAFIDRCPPSSMKETASVAAGSPMLDTSLMGLNMLADTYSRGTDPELGVRIGRAIYALSREAFGQSDSRTHLINAGRSAVNIAVGLNSLGRHEEIIAFVKDAIEWLEERDYRDNIPSLLLYQVEARLNLAQYDEAEALINEPKWQPLFTEDLPGDRQRLEALKRRLERTARQRATELPSKPKSDRDTIIDMRRDMLESLRSLESMASSPEEEELVRNFADALAPEIDKDVPESLTEWFLQSQPTMDALTDFISGAGGELNQVQNQRRIRNAVSIFADPAKGRDPEAIEQSLPILIEARDWAREHDLTNDENGALWGMYLCYSRTGREPQAIDALQALRANLEGMRGSITDPFERAGVMTDSPHLFGALCQLLCRTGRAPELLDAMEGAKGQVLADVLTRRHGQVVADATFSEPTSRIPDLMRKLKAHYLSYFVDDEETYAVFVAKDGSMHSQSIPLGRDAVRQLAKKVDPRAWSGSKVGLFSTAVADPPSNLLEPLVGWLAPLADSGLIEEGDHVCYNPDEALHLVPLHYVTFRGEPLARFVSMSRIQSAMALVALMKEQSSRPESFIAVQVPTQQDLNNAKKLAGFNLVAGWLSEKSPGVVLSNEEADMDRIAHLDWRGQLAHFNTHGTFSPEDQEERNPNPYTSSGLLLAQNGYLPSLAKVGFGKGDDSLLTPERVLDMDFSGSHVTLQACVSGLAKEGIGGDALGLEWALLLAGAQSLLATHWDVPYDKSADFSLRFYQKWLVGKASRAEAWRETVLELMENSAKSGTADPLDWAFFSLSGDWR